MQTQPRKFTLGKIKGKHLILEVLKYIYTCKIQDAMKFMWSFNRTLRQMLVKNNSMISFALRFHVESRCRFGDNEFRFFETCMGRTNLLLRLLYRGSIHGWSVKDFHDRCDIKGPTLVLYQIEDGDCIGGFAARCWGGRYNKRIDVRPFKKDSHAKLFNFSREREFPVRN